MAILYVSGLDPIAEATREPTGFDRMHEDTLGILELSPDGINILRIDEYGVYSTNASGKFALGTPFEEPATIRTLAIFPSSQSFKFWMNGKCIVKTSLEKLSLSNATGERIVYFDDSGELVETTTDFPSVFKYYAPVSGIYGNATTQNKITFSDERHGIRMDGETHSYLHNTRGTVYTGGADITGLVAGGATYTSISSGTFYDEDIKLSPQLMINSPFWYQLPSGWNIAPDSNQIAYKLLGVAQYNRFTTEWGLAPIDNGKYSLVHIFFTNDAQYPYVKILGQNQYATKALAKAGATSEISKLQLDGLPSLEFKALYTIIVNYQGNLELTDDGLTSVDFRKAITR